METINFKLISYNCNVSDVLVSLLLATVVGVGVEASFVLFFAVVNQKFLMHSQHNGERKF
jgi:hypothetical protein